MIKEMKALHKTEKTLKLVELTKTQKATGLRKILAAKHE